ncbi:LysR family transcriptional regulator [Sporosarcina sp. PTS2304]|uniref:LysR family transcriptional regulator n=1 Tax=Sporosarcina sp. PTS2304 TaxID=2283194 RepID=UPI000E0D7203|nr:LysR family transcriptional regulator [Sporosarcina sp. PTS2304]AXI00101.1 LysR family transcriptional regulator [Sporosarcina sp. PTS2304]
MDIRQLHYFKEIVDQGSISKAALVLHMAQPPLSQQLQKLETELGTTLIQRYRQKWEITETGKLLYSYATRLVAEMQEIKLRIREVEEGSAGTLRVGVSSACLNILADYIEIYRKKYPDVKISVYKGDSEELLTKIEEKVIDLAIVLRLNHSKQYAMKKMMEQEYVVVCPVVWGELFEYDDVTFKELANYPFIMLEAMEGHTYYEDVLQAFTEAGVSPNIIMETKDIATVIAMVSKGLGLSIIPRMAYVEPMQQLSLHELKDFSYRAEPVMIKRNKEHISKAALQLWDLVD